MTDPTQTSALDIVRAAQRAAREALMTATCAAVLAVAAIVMAALR